MIFFDTETCGFHGPTVLIQWADEDGEISLHEVWELPIRDTLELIEMFCAEGVIGFNLAFDWFHICQTYTTLSKFTDYSVPPDIEQYALLEKKARDGFCLKPSKAFDVMLHARKGEYQSTMNRGSIRLKKIPTAIAWDVAKELGERIPIKDLYFARAKGDDRWKVYDIHNDLGDINPDFKDIVLKFAPSSALKALAQDALGIKDDAILLFTDVEIDKKFQPVEYGFAPFALGVGTPEDWKGAYPDVIHQHISHWGYNKLARDYAVKDVEHTRGLYRYFNNPEPNDEDSILACMVGAVRWRGFAIDTDGIKALKEKAEKVISSLDYNFRSTAVVKIYLTAVLSELEKVSVQDSTKAVILEELAEWTLDDLCEKCEGLGCSDCNEGTVKTNKPHPVAARAREVLDARHAAKEIELYDKLLRSNRFHASFNIIGTLSNRMSGGDGLNAQGVKKTKEVRSKFPLALSDHILCGGDFDGFEVTIADAEYGDPKLHAELLSGKKIHALFGQHVYPELSYEEILATSGTSDDKYSRCKQAVFAMLFGGEGYTLKERLGVDIETADKAYNAFITEYTQVGVERRKVFDAFCSMRQEGGIGSKVTWTDPKEYIESMFGFKRYFTLENRICKELFNLAEKSPKSWNIGAKVVRRDRLQTTMGAARSAMFACAFALQAANMRAAANHVIQSAGATTTKKLQCAIWKVQPPGINRWRVQPMNIHDEVMCPTHPACIGEVKEAVANLIESLKAKIPLLAMEWHTHLANWAEK